LVTFVARQPLPEGRLGVDHCPERKCGGPLARFVAVNAYGAREALSATIERGSNKARPEDHQRIGERIHNMKFHHIVTEYHGTGYVLEETLKAVEPDAAYFWATHQGAELDLLLLRGGKRLGIEMKRMDAPALTASMRIALTDLKLDQLTVVYPGAKSYELGPRVKVIPVSAIATEGIGGIVPARRIRFRAKGRSHDDSPPSRHGRG
jgi:hypothetical protein